MRQTLTFALMAALLLALSLLSLLTGSIDLAPADVWGALTGAELGETTRFIVVESRLPSLLTALVSGAALAASGLIMQTVFSNPLADPAILGINSAASLGAAVAILLFGGAAAVGGGTFSGFVLTSAFALCGAAAVIVFLMFCSAVLPGKLMLLIAGVMVSYVASALVSLLSFYATDYGVQSYVFWGMGSFSSLTLARLPLYAVPMCLCLVITLLMSKPLNALLLGNDYAASLGINVTRTRTLLLLLTGLLAAATTAVCGPIAFIGLAAPHVARLFLRLENHGTLLPLSMLVGAAICVACNVLAHAASPSAILPINALTPLFGAPVVLFLLLRRKRI